MNGKDPVGEENFSSAFIGSSGWSNNQIDMKEISKRKTN